jgi:putative phosphoesterase
MRLAALYDIHGNAPALEAVLAEVRRAEVDLVVVGGDVLPGPMPQETLDLLLRFDLPVRFIRGNGEREVLASMRPEPNVPASRRDLLAWVAASVSAHQATLASWPLTTEVTSPDLGPILFCHATPRNDAEIFTRITPEARLQSVFHAVEAAVVVCGHTHMQFDRMVGSIRVVNAGSVGMPFSRPGAEWLLLDRTIEFRRTDYDLALAARRIRASGYPQASEFAAGNVLATPSEAATLAALSKVELER